MIGNDIVDLSLAKVESNWQRKGFLRKLFSAEEIDLISDATEPDLMVWKLWSMKESAYKADFRSSKKRKFNPSKFQCEVVTDTSGNVQYEGSMYKTNTLIADDFIHTSAWREGSNNSMSKPIIKTFSTQFSSDKLYQSLVFMVAATKACKEKDLRVIKSSMGIPELYKNQIKLETLCSISHHGRYGAFIMSH